jgi:uncharacterized membrane protein
LTHPQQAHILFDRVTRLPEHFAPLGWSLFRRSLIRKSTSLMEVSLVTFMREPMKTCKSILCVLAFTVATTAADAPKLTFKFTTNNVPGAILTFPAGINNAGTTVGEYEDKNMVYHGYILNGKKMTTVDDSNGTDTSVNGIQYNGTIVVGGYFKSNTVTVGFRYKGGKFTDITGPTGAVSDSANAINDSGAIVGWYEDSNNVIHGFLLKGDKYTTLDVPGAFATVATGINDKGTIVLNWLNSRGDSGSSLTTNNGKTYKSINVPGAGQFGSDPLGLNNEGDVVFLWYDNKTTPLYHGALLHSGKYYKFDFPKAVQTYAGGVNDKSTIVGGYKTKSRGPVSGYKATFK